MLIKGGKIKVNFWRSQKQKSVKNIDCYVYIFFMLKSFLERGDKNSYSLKISISDHTHIACFIRKLVMDPTGGRPQKKWSPDHSIEYRVRVKTC